MATTDYLSISYKPLKHAVNIVIIINIIKNPQAYYYQYHPSAPQYSTNYQNQSYNMTTFLKLKKEMEKKRKEKNAISILTKGDPLKIALWASVPLYPPAEKSLIQEIEFTPRISLYV